MMMAGTMAIVVGIFLCWRLRDRPQAIGLLPIGDWRHDELEIAQQQEGAGLTRKEILTNTCCLTRISAAFPVLCAGVRGARGDQRLGQFVYVRDAGRGSGDRQYRVTMFELGGFIGALVAGWGSDKLFNGNRGPMNLIFAAGIYSVGSLWLMPFASVYVMQAACFFTTGFFVFGPQMLIGMAVRSVRTKRRPVLPLVCWAVRLSWRIALLAGRWRR
jgi:OPA family sugar phosphate sensor protein UhpC-like MFS transporter